MKCTITVPKNVIFTPKICLKNKSKNQFKSFKNILYALEEREKKTLQANMPALT